jgi:hypothetical protein
MNHNHPEDAEVVTVLSREKLWSQYFVEVLCTSYGKGFRTNLMRATSQEAAEIKPGYRFKNG